MPAFLELTVKRPQCAVKEGRGLKTGRQSSSKDVWHMLRRLHGSRPSWDPHSPKDLQTWVSLRGLRVHPLEVQRAHCKRPRREGELRAHECARGCARTQPRDRKSRERDREMEVRQ